MEGTKAFAIIFLSVATLVCILVFGCFLLALVRGKVFVPPFLTPAIMTASVAFTVESPGSGEPGGDDRARGDEGLSNDREGEMPDEDLDGGDVQSGGTVGSEVPQGGSESSSLQSSACPQQDEVVEMEEQYAPFPPGVVLVQHQHQHQHQHYHV